MTSPALARIPVSRPWLDDREAAAAARVIASGWVTQGPEVAAFEQEFAEAMGADHACAVSSCTTALHLALLALNVRPGDEVVTVSHSFIATANAITYCGAVPVFVDVDLATFNMDPARIEDAITPRTRAILCVHQLGMPCPIDAVVEIGRAHGIPVIEDAACAVGSRLRVGDSETWEMVGRPRGHLACFSFHPRKLLTTGDGGMVTTSDAGLDRRIRLQRHHGMSVADSVRHAAVHVIEEQYTIVGYNYRMTDIQAAIGREQLRKLPIMVERRRELAARYDERLSGVPGLVTPREPSWARSNWQSYAVRVPDRETQRRVMQALLDEGISTRRGVMNAHREPAYQSGGWRAAPGGLARSEQAQDTGIILPLYHELTSEDQDRVCAALLVALGATSAR